MKTQRKQVTIAVLLVLGALGLTARAQNATPFIDATSPVSAHVGGSDLTITIEGAGFAPTAMVNWEVGNNSTPLLTNFGSATRLTATIPADLLKTATTATVTVFNPNTAPAEKASNSVFFPVTVISDYNGDGRLD